MNDLGVLRDLAIIIGLAIPIVALAHRVRVPPLVGFLLVGVVIGPHGVALIPEPEEVSALSEIGVVLLLFAIGLELSLSDVLRRGRAMMVTGGAQMAGMLGLAVLLGMATDTPLGRTLFYGALAAMSSTAVVTKSYADRGELDTPSRARGRIHPGVPGPLHRAAHLTVAAAWARGGGDGYQRVDAHAGQPRCDDRTRHRRSVRGPAGARPHRRAARPRAVYALRGVFRHRDGAGQRGGRLLACDRRLSGRVDHLRIGIRPAGALRRPAVPRAVQWCLLHLDRDAS